MRSYMGFQQRKDLEADKDYFEKQLVNPLVQDKPTVRRNIQKIEHDLETQSPPIKKGKELDEVARREKELREKIVPNMLSQAEMRQAPPGSVGREMAFQKRFKTDILEWKNCRRVLYRESDDPDVANIEVFRPTVSRGNLDNAWIPGKSLNFASPAFQAGYEQVDFSRQEGAQEFETEASKERRQRLSDLRAKFEADLAAIEAEGGEESGTDSNPEGDVQEPQEEENGTRLGFEKEE